MKGRKPQPVEERLKNGNPQRRPVPEPILVGGRPTGDELMEPPEDLPPDGKRLWRKDVRRLAEVGIIDLVDTAALEAMCIAYSRAKQAGRALAHDGLFVTGAAGQARPHPALAMETNAWNAYRLLAEQFAMTPVARTRLGLAELNRRSLQAELSHNLGQIDLHVVPDGD